MDFLMSQEIGLLLHFIHGGNLTVHGAAGHWNILFWETCDLVVIQLVKDVAVVLHISGLKWNWVIFRIELIVKRIYNPYIQTVWA